MYVNNENRNYVLLFRVVRAKKVLLNLYTLRPFSLSPLSLDIKFQSYSEYV